MRRRCFIVPGRIAVPDGEQHTGPRYDGPVAEALAKLLPVLGCGEEAAAIAFDDLARRECADEAAALRTIAAEERLHDALIEGISRRLPEAAPPLGLLATSRHFHMSLGGDGATLHLARIAALDAAVCTILGALLCAGGPLSTLRHAAPVLQQIRRDEVGHVRIARAMVARRGADAGLRDAAATTRETLAQIMTPMGDALEVLAVDPMALDRRIRRLPDGLLKW
ncbi:3-oxoacyl-ACP synthase [Sphingomonas glacialis]|uniref:3-oxoacyl-ACP synthase n=1 Tax=Sphingomonas glacialis TaxID=658225 RepID=A0A502FRV3_9SPHN|nr:3-oxoacyl-ACP synthase [Sphingomonas glacialis]TPG52174.1 3-oxoacyl-ACP synthase [Sphingomonas glacialis]